MTHRKDVVEYRDWQMRNFVCDLTIQLQCGLDLREQWSDLTCKVSNHVPFGFLVSPVVATDAEADIADYVQDIISNDNSLDWWLKTINKLSHLPHFEYHEDVQKLECVQ